MIKIIIKKQLNEDPLISIYKNGTKIRLRPVNVEVTQNKITFELDVNLKPRKKRLKKSNKKIN